MICALQEVEGCLFDFSQVLATILESLMGTVIMEKPRQFLALSSLLQLLASKQVNLASSTHAVIQVCSELYLELLKGRPRTSVDLYRPL